MVKIKSLKSQKSLMRGNKKQEEDRDGSRPQKFKSLKSLKEKKKHEADGDNAGPGP